MPPLDIDIRCVQPTLCGFGKAAGRPEEHADGDEDLPAECDENPAEIGGNSELFDGHGEPTRCQKPRHGTKAV